MKILIASSLYGTSGGGAGLIAEYISRGLMRASHQVTVVTIGGDAFSICNEQNGVKLIWFKPANIYSFTEKDLHPSWQKIIWQLLDIYNFQCARIFSQILKEEAPDIVHIHKMRGFSGAVWSVAAKLLPGRVVQTFHDYESMSPDGLLRGSIGRMALRKQWPIRGYQIIRSKLSMGILTVTAPSVHLLKRIKNSGLFPRASSHVIANTHGWSENELRSLHENGAVMPKEDFRFLFLGRLEREKGVLELCDAFLQAFRFRANIHLDIAGWGSWDSELRQKYKDHANIHFLGALHGQAREGALRNATIVVVPSIVEEVFGLVASEAFAFGKPVIASNIGGLPEVIREGETGWLVEAGNISSLANKLLAATELSPTMLDNIGQACREYSYEFSVDKILSQYLHVYGQLLK
jgi:glycosyltransferase involved in cell wall biosynthesis